MASKSETGHAKNLANFATLISFCTGYGSSYNPSREALKVANLQTVFDAAETALSDCKDVETALKNATNARKDLFKPIKKLGTKIINAFVTLGLTDTTNNSAKSINRKLQGKRATPKDEPQNPPPTDGQENSTPLPNYNSVSQQSFDYIIEYFDALIKLVASHEEYQPNEPELQVTALNTLLVNLKLANQNVLTAETSFSNQLITRNNIMYAYKTGLVAIAADVKGYVKSMYSSSSPQYKQVSGLSFKTIPN
jgi:hypothetical protein